MNRKSVVRSAFFSPRFLLCFAVCIIGLLLALVPFAINSNGNPTDEVDRLAASKQALRKINAPVFDALPLDAPTGTPSPTAPPTVCSFAEGMDVVGNLPGWVMNNLSDPPPGTTGWFQGNTAIFTAQSGAGNSYIGANFNNTGGTTGAETISNWLLTPPVTLQNGGGLVFWTRTVTAPAFPDRLQVRMSTNGTSTNVGSTSASVGDFATLLLDINPTYQTTGSGSYPNNWTQFVVPLSGLGLPIKGRLAFRYFVENAGPNGINSDYIGIDSVSYNCNNGYVCPPPPPPPTPGTPTPTPTATPPFPADISLVSRLSDARASAGGSTYSDSPPAQTQTNFLAANLHNSAFGCSSGFEGTTCSGNSTSNSSITGDDSMGTVRITGDGSASANGWVHCGGQASAKVIDLTFSIANNNYSYSLSGQVSAFAGQFGGNGTATGKLMSGSLTIFQAMSGNSNPGTMNFSQTGVLLPGTYTLSFDLTASSPSGNAAANFNFLLTRCPGCTSPPGQCPLYDQTSSPGTNGTSSQDFETANDAFDNQAADDFIVPSGQTWNIQQVYAGGAYFNGSGPMLSINVYFYSDSGGFPGSLVASYLNTAIGFDSSGSLTITLPGNGLLLGPGAYWLSLQARMDFSTAGQWAWSNRTVTSNNAAAWQNPGGGFGAGCATWGRRGATCGIDSAAPDQVFQLKGCTPSPSPTSTPSTVTISGSVSNCASPAPTATPPATPTPPTLPPVPNVLMTLTGSSSGTTLTDASGNYSFTIAAGGSYAVTPTKGPLVPGTGSINTIDVLAVQRHFLGLTIIPAGCRLSAADAVINGIINTQDVIAIQRFFLGYTSGTGSVGQYKFNPASASYSSIGGNQVTNYSMYVIGDVATPFNN